ncbi:hypothetical protein KY317_03090 [Candidatus Woesearchaeota archaeon]|nr:hypothetical protein [Candidatus Woesearchaeota archaeon]
MKLSKEGVSIETKDYTVFTFMVSLIFFLGYVFLLGYIGITRNLPNPKEDLVSFIIMLSALILFFIALLLSDRRWGTQAENIEKMQKELHKVTIEKIKVETKVLKKKNKLK